MKATNDNISNALAKKLSLLLIENDKVDELALLRAVAENKLPYEVSVTRSISEARQILDKQCFDIIVADFNLSDGCAFDLQDDFSDQVVIFITGAGTEEIAAQAFKIGVSDYLIKDAERNYLKLLPNRIDAVMQQKVLTRQLNERLKEMTCLYEIRRSLNLNLSTKEACLETIKHLVTAIQLPEIINVMIEIDGDNFVSKNYNPTQISASSSMIYVQNEMRGQLSVHYSTAESFLLPEELNLISAIASDLGWWLGRKEDEASIRIAAVAFESLDGVMITDVKGQIARVNNAFTKITGFREDEIINKLPSILKSGLQNEVFFKKMWEALNKKNYWQGELDQKHKDGTICSVQWSITAVKDTAGKTTHYVGVFQDLSERKDAERKIHTLSFYDELTGLSNRRYLIQRLKESISMSENTKHYGALLYLNMDHFKSTNDLFGHNKGDEFLVEIANRLKRCIHETDTIARFGGDEFVVLLVNLGTKKGIALRNARGVAERLQEALNKSYLCGQNAHFITTSIGIGVYSSTDSSDELIKQTNEAMHQAKALGKNRLHFFDPVLQHVMHERIKLEAELRCALVDGQQFQLHYQIQVNDNNKTVGVEALIRWNHPEHGLIYPNRFIFLAEEGSLIIQLGQWVIDAACKQLSAWSVSATTNQLSIAINISGQQFHNAEFIDSIKTAIRKHDIKPSLLKLELTESIVLDESHAVEQIAALRKLGVLLSLDDFGTGYSSLSYLRKLKVDQLKIDQSFVRDISIDCDNGVMAKTVIGLARNFHLDVVSEGVETEYQLAFLKSNGCTLFQGYLFAKPSPIEDLDALLDKYPAIEAKPAASISRMQ